MFYIEAAGLYYTLSHDENGFDEHALVSVERADAFSTRERAEQAIKNARPSLQGFDLQIVEAMSNYHEHAK